MKRPSLLPLSRKFAGFTLVELLVAITVLAIVAVLGWRGLDGIVRSRQQLTEQMEQTRGIQLTFAQLQSDLEQIADRDLLRQHQNILADNQRLVFIRTVQNENTASQLQVISYRINDGVLARRESPYTRDLQQLDGLWQRFVSDNGDGGVQLQSGVASMAVRVWEGGNWTPAANASTAFTGSATPPVTPPCDEANGGCQGTGNGAPSPPSGGNPPGPVKPPAAASNNGPTGLEITLQLQGQPAVLSKVFLLGAI
jgi:general secretion pathway protein J